MIKIKTGGESTLSLKNKNFDKIHEKIKSLVIEKEQMIHDLSNHFKISIPLQSSQPFKKDQKTIESIQDFKLFRKESESNLGNLFLEIPKENLDFIFEELKNDETIPHELHSAETFSEISK